MVTEHLLRLLLAALIGAVIGAEREFRDKAAGLRTIILICIGSCLFTIFGAELSRETTDPTRITAAVVSGVGFLGAGVIFRRGRQSTGITTAAVIWCSAALGMGIGGGLYAVTLAAAGGVLVVLWLLPPVERLIDESQESKTYAVRTIVGAVSIDAMHQTFEDAGLRIIDCSHGKRDGLIISEFATVGKHEYHTALTHDLINADWVEQIDV